MKEYSSKMSSKRGQRGAMMKAAVKNAKETVQKGVEVFKKKLDPTIDRVTNSWD